MTNFGWNYPPGVRGNEPELTGEYPCAECYGEGADQDEDGWNSCPRCEGSGIEPEELSHDYVTELLERDYIEKDLLKQTREIMEYDTTFAGLKLSLQLLGRWQADYGKE